MKKNEEWRGYKTGTVAHCALTIFLVLGIGLAGCSNPFEDPLKKYVNDHFPPVAEADQRAKAIETDARTLAALTSPNLAPRIASRNFVTGCLTGDVTGEARSYWIRGLQSVVRQRGV
jgi:hypothetical protein